MNTHDWNTVSLMSENGSCFEHALAELCFLADARNLDRLKFAFPEVFQKFEAAATVEEPAPAF